MSRALEVVGERWSLLIVRDALFAGSTRFSDFQKTLGIAPNVLTARLERLVEAGVMERDTTASPTQPRYLLTQAGRELAVPVAALTAWGDRWAAPGEPPILFRHRDCDAPVEVAVRCAECGQVPADDVVAAIGPGMPDGFVEQRRRLRGLS